MKLTLKEDIRSGLRDDLRTLCSAPLLPFGFCSERIIIKPCGGELNAVLKQSLP